MYLNKEGVILLFIFYIAGSLAQQEDGWEIFEVREELGNDQDKGVLYREIKDDETDKDLDLLWDYLDADNNQRNEDNSESVIQMDNSSEEENSASVEDDEELTADSIEDDEARDDSSSEESKGVFWQRLKNLAKNVFENAKNNQGSMNHHSTFINKIMGHRRNGRRNPFGWFWKNRNNANNGIESGNFLSNIHKFFKPSEDGDTNSSPFSEFAKNFMTNFRQNNQTGLHENMRNMWAKFRNCSSSRNNSNTQRYHHHHHHHQMVHNNNNHTGGDNWMSSHGIHNKTLFMENHSKLICMIVTGAKKMKFFEYMRDNFRQNDEDSTVEATRMMFINKTLSCCEEDEPSDCLLLLRQERIDKFCDENMAFRPWATFSLMSGLEDNIRSACCEDRGDGWHQCTHEQKRIFWNSLGR